MQFRYELSDNKGKIKKGVIEAADRSEAQTKLSVQDGIIVSLDKMRDEKKVSKTKGGVVIGSIKMIEKVMLAKHLAVMIASGMSIDDSLETLAENGSPIVTKRLNQVLDDVRQGFSLSDAMKKYPRDFDHLFVNMVAVGEASGTLAENMKQLSVQLRKTYELKSKLKAASLYPSIIVLAIIGLIVVLSVFVLPRILVFFTSLSVELPLSTKILLLIAGFFSNHWIIVVSILGGLFVGVRVLVKLKATRIYMHRMILHMPIVGKISRSMNLALFSRTLGSLLNSGITIDRSLQIVEQTINNEVFKREIIYAYHGVLKGGSLESSLAHSKYFPSIVYRMSMVGERSGNLSEVLEHLADYYESEVDVATKNLSTTLEPLLLVVIGLVVGFVAMSIINPIYELTSSVSASR